MTEVAYCKISCNHCGGHIAFPPSTAGETVTCPHCGKHIFLPYGLESTEPSASTDPTVTKPPEPVRSYRLRTESKPKPENTNRKPEKALAEAIVELMRLVAQMAQNQITIGRLIGEKLPQLPAGERALLLDFETKSRVSLQKLQTARDHLITLLQSGLLDS